MSAFCEPETTESSPHSSVSQGTAPRLEIASTAMSAPASFAAAARARTSQTTPVEVSDCVTSTALAPPSSREPGSEVVGGRRLAPLVARCARRRSRTLGRCRPSARRSSRRRRRPRGRPARSGSRPRTEPRRARGRVQQDLALRPVDSCRRSSTCRYVGLKSGAAVMDDRERHRSQHLRRNRCRPGRHQIALLGQATEPSSACDPSALTSQRLRLYSVEALFAFGAALLSLRLASAVAGRWRATRRPELAAWSCCAPRLRGGVGGARPGAPPHGWDARSFRVYYLFGALLTAPLLGVGSLLLYGWKRIIAPCAHLRRACGRDCDLRSTARSIRREHPGRPGPPRVLPCAVRGDRREHGSARWPSLLWRSSRSGVGRSATGSSWRGSALPPLAPLYPAWVLRKRPFLWQLQHFFFTEVLQPLRAGALTNR